MPTNRTHTPAVDSVWHDTNTNTTWRVRRIYEKRIRTFDRTAQYVTTVELRSMADSRIGRHFALAEWKDKPFTEVV